MDIEQLNNTKRQSQASSFMATERLRRWFGLLLPQFSTEASLSPSSSSSDLFAPSTYGSIVSVPSPNPRLNNLSAFNEDDENAFPHTHKLRLKLVHLGKLVNASTLFTLAMGVLLFSCLAIGSFNVSRGGGVIKAEPFPNLYNVAYAATEKPHNEDKDQHSLHDHGNETSDGSSNATAKHTSQSASDAGNSASPQNSGSSITAAPAPMNPAAIPTVVANTPPVPSTPPVSTNVPAPPLTAEQAAVIARQAADRAAAVATAAAARNTEENLRAQALAAEANRRAEASAEENAKARAKASEKKVKLARATSGKVR